MRNNLETGNINQPEKEEKKPKKFTKAVVGATVGVLMGTSASVGLAESKITERQKIEKQIEELQKRLDNAKSKDSQDKAEKMKDEKQKTLDEFFGIKDLELGEPKRLIRCPCEQRGLYLKGKHLGDMYAKGMKLEKNELVEKTAKILKENKINLEKTKYGLREQGKIEGYVVSDEVFNKNVKETTDFKVIKGNKKADQLMTKWGARLEGNVFYSGETKLFFNEDTEKVEFKGTEKGELKVIIYDKKEAGGKITVVTYDENGEMKKEVEEYNR